MAKHTPAHEAAKYSKLFRRVEPPIWDRMLSEGLEVRVSPASLVLWIISGPNSTQVPGLARGGEREVAGILGCDVSTLRNVVRDLERRGWLIVDWRTRLLFVPHAVEFNVPWNENQIAGWLKVVEEIPESDALAKVAAELITRVTRLNPRISASIGQLLSPPLTTKEKEKDQVQKQEQERENDHKRDPAMAPAGPMPQVGLSSSFPDPSLDLFSEEGREDKDKTPILNNEELSHLTTAWRAHRGALRPLVKVDDPLREKLSSAIIRTFVFEGRQVRLLDVWPEVIKRAAASPLCRGEREGSSWGIGAVADHWEDVLSGAYDEHKSKKSLDQSMRSAGFSESSLAAAKRKVRTLA